MIKNSTKRVTTNSDFAELTVTSSIPQRYSVNLGTTLYGTIEAVQIAACGRQYPVKPGDTLFQETKVKFSATPDKGYGIASWTVNNVKQDTYEPNIICKLNENTTVSAAFNTFLYNVAFDIIPNTQQNQGNADWGTLKAVTNSTILPIGETTVLNSRMPIIFTAAPKSGYSVNYWTLNGEIIKNSDGTDFIGKTYTFNPVSQDTEIKVQFMKSENYNIKVIKQIIDNGITYIDDSRLDISVDGLINKDVPFKGTEAVLSVSRGSEAIINLVPPTSAILDSWTVDGVPQKVEVPGLTLSNIAKDTTLIVNYKIFFSKTFNYSVSGADGSVTAALKSENSKETKPIINGTSVQMDQFAELTAKPKDNLGIKTWLVNGNDMQTQDSTFKVKIMGNTSVTTVFESAPKSKEPIDKVSITGPVTKPVLAVDLASDPDGDEVCFDSISAQPDGKVAVASLDQGAKSINITGVDKGSTSVKVIISDGKGHTVEVEIAIVVINADQKAPTGLEGVAVTDKYVANGKITGFDASKVYEYKKTGAAEYLTFSGGTELKFLEAGNYDIRYAAIKGHNAGATCSVNVPYKPVYYVSVYANPAEGGKISNPNDAEKTVSGYYLAGTWVTAKAVSNPNYVFEGWWNDDKLVSKETSYDFRTGSKNTIIEARFKPIETALETGNVTTTAAILGSENNPINGITLNGAGNYKVGESVTVSVYGEPESCEFAYWQEGDSIVSYTSDYEFIQPAGNRNLTAYFQKPSYNVTVSSSDNSKGTVSGTGLYKVGATVTIDAKPNENSLFDYWTIDGEISGIQSKLTFAMKPKDVQIVAHFKPLSHFVSLIANPDSAGTLTGSKLYSEGDTVTITASAKDGYEFGGWTENGVTVSANPDYSFNLGTTDRCFVANFLKTWQVTFDKNGGTTEASPTKLAAVYGKTVKKLPTNPTRSGYNFTGWNTSADGTGKIFSVATSVTEDITVYAQWELITPTNGTGITNTTTQPDTTQKTVIQPEEIKPNAPAIKSENGITTITLGVTAKSKGTGIVEALVSTDEVKDTVSQLNKKALENGNFKKSVIIDVYSPENTKLIETYIDKEALKLIADSKAETLVIKANSAIITFDKNAIDSMLKEASGNIKITVSSYGVSELKGLTDEQRKEIGSRQVYDFLVSSGDKLISDLGGNVLVTVPYTLKQGEDPNAIVIYSINKDNSFEAIANCVYDSKNGTITFVTRSLLRFAIAYNKANFKDVPDTAWYKDAVTFAFARGITTGSGEGIFNPDGKLTRGQFLVMVMRAYGIEPESNPENNFADAGNNYYTGYLAKAKSLKLSQGTGSNCFMPEQLITREEMLTLLYNILKYLDKLPADTGSKNISDFSDAKDISAWAVEGMTLFVKAGIINGDYGLLMPKTVSNRAQMVQILFKLINK